MFVGCGYRLLWRKKGPAGPVLDEDVDALRIIGIVEEYSPVLGKANVAHFLKPNRINLKRSRALSPDSIRE